MTRFRLGLAYALLFPILGFAYFALMIVGQIGSPPFELEMLRPFGQPTLGNLIEIPIAALAGAFGAVLLLVLRKLGRLEADHAIWWYVRGWYIAAFAFYMLMPSLPE